VGALSLTRSSPEVATRRTSEDLARPAACPGDSRSARDRGDLLRPPPPPGPLTMVVSHRVDSTILGQFSARQPPRRAAEHEAASSGPRAPALSDESSEDGGRQPLRRDLPLAAARTGWVVVIDGPPDSVIYCRGAGRSPAPADRRRRAGCPRGDPTGAAPRPVGSESTSGGRRRRPLRRRTPARGGRPLVRGDDRARPASGASATTRCRSRPCAGQDDPPRGASTAAPATPGTSRTTRAPSPSTADGSAGQAPGGRGRGLGRGLGRGGNAGAGPGRRGCVRAAARRGRSRAVTGAGAGAERDRAEPGRGRPRRRASGSTYPPASAARRMPKWTLGTALSGVLQPMVPTAAPSATTAPSRPRSPGWTSDDVTLSVWIDSPRRTSAAARRT
jgi:hypothetical protein